jgi:carbon-monoxide dehydrogenase medium subunit
VKFPAFAYRTPSSLEEASEILSSGFDAKIIAGGQSLLPLLALRLAQPELLVDLRQLRELSFVEAGDGVIRIGAATTLSTLEDSHVIAEKLPLLAQAIRYVAHRPIRNRGSIGGSLAHADPSAEMPAVALALDATLVAFSATGERRVHATDFFSGPFMTALRDDEILTSIEFPVHERRWAFVEIARRSGDFALAIAAVGITAENGICTQATVVLQGVGPKPVRSQDAERVLIDSPMDPGDAARVAEAATANLRPSSDIHGSSDYRKQVAATLVRRAVIAAGRSDG